MKSLILKDLYNIGSTAKSLILIFVVFTISLPSFGVTGYVFSVAMVCGMLNITTFNYDMSSSWEKYGLITPVTRNQVVAAKFITLLIFSGIGTIIGIVIGTIGGFIIGEFTAFNTDVLVSLVSSVAALSISTIIGGMAIPFIIKYGPETARILIFVAILIPVAVFVGLYYLLQFCGVVFTDQLIFAIVCCSPLVAIVWNFIVYKISCGIYAKKEF